MALPLAPALWFVASMLLPMLLSGTIDRGGDALLNKLGVPNPELDLKKRALLQQGQEAKQSRAAMIQLSRENRERDAATAMLQLKGQHGAERIEEAQNLMSPGAVGPSGSRAPSPMSMMPPITAQMILGL